MSKLEAVEETLLASAHASPTSSCPLSDEQLRKMHAYWRAVNYLTVGQIYLKDNPLLERPLTREDIKPRLLGHWGTTAGLNFIYTHLNRLIVENDLNMIYIIGPATEGRGYLRTHIWKALTRRFIRTLSRTKTGCAGSFFNFPGPTAFPVT